MEKNATMATYEAPRIEDHGDLTALTAANHAKGSIDANYFQGEAQPPGGVGSGP